MTGAVAAAGLAGALAAGGLVDLTPDVVAGARRWRARRAAGASDAAGTSRAGRRLVPASVGTALVLLVLGTPTLALVVGIGPAGLRALRRRRHERRRRAVGRGAPQVARSIADALDAGHGVRRAIGEASRSSGLTGPAAEELRRVAARLESGEPLAPALDAWRARTDEPAHRTIVAGLLLHGEAGGELADVLRDQAEALERARRATAEAESAIVQARSAARIVGGIPALVMIGTVVLAPGAVAQVTGNALGAVLVVAAVLLQVAAMIAVRRLTMGLSR
ncbi:type II secretion system F family protein [Patulibacter sp.]|uniref:type II secretion system F family protein n=1 Tax=Patulibacter sp. TaxID=1912859 RepID=UPI0027239219|nr:type II secretion system F family protein [Patulibacter sp.]MDO9409717.1 type II secretion system F family protein [Patulibacter sp.]